MRTSTTKDTGGVTIERFSDRLAVYLEGQSAVESLRDVDMPQFPWPDTYNPMLEYLVHRSAEIAESDGRPAAVIWLAAHAWFEGSLAALAFKSTEGPSPITTCDCAHRNRVGHCQDVTAST